MFTNSSPIQDRRGAAKHLDLQVFRPHMVQETQSNSLPPLKSPRGHLLDRIRSTPRSSKFVPQSAPVTDEPVRHGGSHAQPYHQQTVPDSNPASTTAVSAAARASNIYTPRRNSASQFHQTQNLARSDQLALLEQQLRSQNDLLAQQQLLLQQLQIQGQSNMCATPPYTPNSTNSRQAQGQNNNVVYDPATGQYYMFAPPVQYNQGHVTPSAKARPVLYTPDSTKRVTRPAEAQRSLTPPKGTQAIRQPNGPPAIEALISDTENAINFGSRIRKSAQLTLEAGLPRRRASLAGVTISRPTSRASQQSTGSLGPIDEAFPAIEQ
ncbi:protein of unknown function [Taphrina deformans PYCC 5710]|uniref:Uncharacterized protein n=1 Tax=Taphrina deformans (strain PYCC 5710 / ATCC 11124 / CBS 356.35 / IMI 108563 / JCM 9778 / NBRC 8474) TaxID=1097556 RepID=R4XFT9_TAPDE|nr:protein of unknown function [Taphrina deformans PYCC 5710]|eukprot:CCG82234.1 protein of unknown function [Taphrina deformans PYCC 5710]